MFKRKGRKPIVRKDPPTRAPDGSQPWGKLRNPDPEKHYVCVDPNNPLHGVEYYEHLGYTQTLKTEGGPRFVLRGKGDGDSVISQMGSILMEIPLGDTEDPQEGTKAFLDYPGQAEADAIERRIVNKKGTGVDPIRGRHGYFAVVNETSGQIIERGA